MLIMYSQDDNGSDQGAAGYEYGYHRQNEIQFPVADLLADKFPNGNGSFHAIFQL